MCSCVHYIRRFYFSTQPDSLCLSIQNFKLFAFSITINLFPSSDKIFYTFLVVPSFCVSLIFITASWVWSSFPMKVKATEPCLTFCDPMDYSPTRILEWVAFPFSRGSSQPRDGTQVSKIAGRFFTAEPPGKPFLTKQEYKKKKKRKWRTTLHPCISYCETYTIKFTLNSLELYPFIWFTFDLSKNKSSLITASYYIAHSIIKQNK